MGAATVKALTLMGIALPTMFAVICIFMFATSLLNKSFPYNEEDDDD